MKVFIRSVLFGNYYYGLCAIALTLEASFQQSISLNSLPYYLLIYSGTVVYYTHAYIAERDTGYSNDRTHWYIQNRRFVKYSQLLLTLVFLASALCILNELGANLKNTRLLQWATLLLFPLIAAFYYGSIAPGRSTNNLRKHGWLKPFVIGFVWAGAVTVYPVVFNSIEQGIPYSPGFISLLLFVKNFMFITMLCIMFDIKDFAADHNHRLKTFVVSFGLRKTIFYILIPLTLIGLGTFIGYAFLLGFPLLRVLINIIPFILLIIVAYSMHRRKSILYYLAIIDGLMLAKAACGITGTLIIK